MKITKIQIYDNKTFIQNRKNNTKNTEIAATNPISFAYQDFSISFKGRTPEDFYEQEFNVKFMPDTMNKYLNENYESRRHMPPEQIMSESFKYLTVADTIEDVKDIYKEEPLFENLHEASLKGRSGVLSDIKLAREMSDIPLFTDGSDHLGVYLLKKIFLEGKTIKEINKDFYEKDLNPEYKGIITQPITYGTTSAYGIRYPKTDFWNSFIATRDEYKKFFIELPKQTKSELKKELKTPEKKPYVRKYTIKKYQKDQLKQDIKKSKGSEKTIADSIRKRFTKDDPEAAFIIKYLSPIMTIAADKIHLSEEERFFAESEKSKGRKLENFFASFWKSKPELLEQYSTAITDTIELFEENYGSGGLIPINNEYQEITAETKNKKAIDFVPQEFLELLDNTQKIVPARLKALADYEASQEKWNEHFLWRYGEIQPEEEPAPNVQAIDPIEILKEKAQKNNAQVYMLKGTDNNDVAITVNLDEFIADYLRKDFIGFPPKFVNMLINFTLKHPMMTENAKLSFATIKVADKIDDERILGKTGLDCIRNFIKSELEFETAAASMAALDVFAKFSDSPEKIYRTLFPNYEAADANEYSLQLLKYKEDAKIKDELNRLYDIYRKAPSQSELNKIKLKIVSFIRDFNISLTNSPKSVIYELHGLASNISQLQEMLKDKQVVPKINNLISKMIIDSKVFYTKSLLFGQENKAQYQAKTEIIACNVINILINKAHQLK